MYIKIAHNKYLTRMSKTFERFFLQRQHQIKLEIHICTDEQYQKWINTIFYIQLPSQINVSIYE